MNTIKIVLLLIACALFSSSAGFSQYEELPKEEKTYKNSGGIDYRYDYGYANIGIVYRRKIADSKYNFRANLYLGEEEGENVSTIIYTNTYNTFGMAVVATNDTNYPLLGIREGYESQGSFQKIELGFEREFSIWKFNIIGGVDLSLGHSFRSGSKSLIEAVLYEIDDNGVKYYEFGEREFDSTYFGEPVNTVTVKRNYLSFGIITRVGMKYDFTNRIFATAFIGLRLEKELMISESVNHKNDLFKELLPYNKGFNSVNLNTFASIGLHYRF